MTTTYAMARMVRPFRRHASHAFVRTFTRALEEWTSTHVCCAATAAALVSFAIAWHALRVVHHERLLASQAAVAALQARLDDAAAKIRSLPALRRQAAASRPSDAVPGVAEQLDLLGDAATRAGLLLDALEPAAQGSGGGQADRAFRLQASGDFFNALRFFNELRRLPMFTLPSDVLIRVRGARLALDTSLTTHTQADESGSGESPSARTSRLPGAAALPPLPPNPFATRDALPRFNAARATPVLVGAMRDGSRGAALFALGDATALVRTGGVVESDRVTRIGLDAVTVVGRDAVARVIRFSGKTQ